MLIGELSKKTGLTKDTIRFYEKQGLIPRARKERPFNSYKEYTDEMLHRLLLIKKIKAFGFTLNETSVWLDRMELNSATCEFVAQGVSEKVELLDKKIKELQELKSLLTDKVNSCCGTARADENCPALVIA